jgi:hypothetical protein
MAIGSQPGQECGIGKVICADGFTHFRKSQ